MSAEAATLLEAALAAHQAGDLDAAEPLYRRVLELDPAAAQATHLLGLIRRQRGDLQGALALLLRALSLNPRSALAHQNLGLVLLDLGRHEDALRHLQLALRFMPDAVEALFACASALQALDRPEEALARWDDLLARVPDHAAALLNRGMVRQDLQHGPEAEADFAAALALDPDLAGILLGRALALPAERATGTLALLDRILTHRPDFLDARVSRATTLRALGRHREALVDLDLALAAEPRSLPALVARSAVLLGLGRPTEALAACDRALAVDPACLEALQNRGVALLDLKHAAAALAVFEAALALHPEWPDLLANVGTALQLLGRHREALAAYRRVLELDPTHATAHSNVIFLMEFLPGEDFASHQRERRAWAAAHAGAWAGVPAPAPLDPDPDRRLVVGYVSADFRNHATASIFLPILRRHDRARFQVNCYSGVVAEDDWTRKCRDCAEVWRTVRGLDDDALAGLIREDRVDVLVDLSGHTAGHRLLAFARRPAPVQVSAWGYGGGTGLAQVDALFADPVAIPPEVRHLFPETVWDLPCNLTFEAPEDAPEPAPPPVLGAPFTFGCLNRYGKVTPEVERLWARILAARPDARLLLKDALFSDPACRSEVAARWAALGVEPSRLLLLGATGRREHLQAYGLVDLALDPWPQNGGLTTFEALWMGVPVLALLGGALGSRAAGAILHAVGLPDWVAADPEAYVDLALAKAADLHALAGFRRESRARLGATATGNPDRYTRAVEAAYRELWQRRVAR